MSLVVAAPAFDIKKLTKNKRPKSFFKNSADYVAKNILGDYLILKKDKRILIGRIVETEGYLGVGDDASHSFGGKITPRNKIMYEEGGIIYVYLIYGKFWCFNIVVSKKKDPQAIFIRALEPVAGIDAMRRNRAIDNIKKLTNGPCRWTQSFKINKSFSGKDITKDEIFISRGRKKDFSVVRRKRIGVDYATKSKDLLLRFYIKSNPFVSRD
jgi:DNA-3-methyladenine glycosylase